MPKVTRKDAAAPLQEAGPSHMEEDDVPVASISGEPGNKPSFPALSAYELNGKMVQFRRVPVPQHRMTPLKTGWLALYKPVTQNLKLDMRMNLKTRKVRRRRAVGQDASLPGCLVTGASVLERGAPGPARAGPHPVWRQPLQTAALWPGHHTRPAPAPLPPPLVVPG